MAIVTIYPNSSGLHYGSSIMTTSTGNIYVVFPTYNDGGWFHIYKSTNGGANWSDVYSVIYTDLGFEVSYGLSAAIDGDDYIHILYASGTSSKYLNYNRFNTSNDTFVGAWEQVTGGSSGTSITRIAIDSSNKPHVIWGVYDTYLKYSNKVSGSWLATPENVAAAGSGYTLHADMIVHGNADDIQVIYANDGVNLAPNSIHRSSGGWGTPVPFTNEAYSINKSAIIFDGTNYHYAWCKYNSYAYGDDTLVSQLTNNSYSWDTIGCAWLNGCVYYPYNPTGFTTWKVKLYKVATSQWLGPFDLTWSSSSNPMPKYIKYEYSHNFQNETTRINALFESTSYSVCFDYIEDIQFVTSSKSAYVKGRANTTSSKSANVQSGTMVRDDTMSCYMFGTGEDLVPDGDIANQTGWKNEAEGTTLYTSLADNSDSTYVYKQPSAVDDYFEVSLSGLQYAPISTANHLIIWRIENLSGQTVVAKIELRQGTSTVIASDQQTLTGSVVEYTKKLTQGEVNSIGGDYSDLRLRFTVVSIT